MARLSPRPASARTTRLRRPAALLAGLALAALAGCQQETVTSYRVPRLDTPPPRLLAAIVPAGEKIWFFKLAGPAPEVAAHQAEFDRFVNSLNFLEAGDPPVTWVLPEGWEERPSREALRYATIRVGPEKLELTVVPLGREAADQLANVNRWRRQIDLPPITEAELAPLKRDITVNGRAVTLVDMTGGGKPRMAAPPAAPARTPQPAAGGPPRPSFDAPAGWQPVPIAPGGMRVAAYKVTDGDRSAEVTVIPLSGSAGGLLANVNRWRGEVGLGPLTDDQLPKESKTLDTPAGPAVVVDLPGPESAGSKRTLGAILPRDGTTWFIKLHGPAELVGKQQANFEAFVRSLRFGAAQGAK
jgi:hypothetical protein